MRIAILSFLLSLGGLSLAAQSNLLQSGPMLGYGKHKEVLIWVQTKAAAEVYATYQDDSLTTARYRTPSVQTTEREGFTARLLATQVQPGRSYTYTIYINGQAVALSYPTRFRVPSLWQWRTDPPTFTVAAGSCMYINEPAVDRPGRAYGSEEKLLTTIAAQRPDVMLWLGDNTYLREVDWYSRTGMLHRYTHTRSVPELQPLLASAYNYATWDDHDYGPNDSDRSFVYKDMAKEVFSLFWGNPTYGIPQVPEGITTAFHFNDVDFFLLDNRYFRSPNNRKTGAKTLLGEAQLEWLIDALAASHAPFKMVVVGGQVLNTATVYETYANLAPQERGYLLDRIEAEEITGVVFVTGDRHHTELSKLTNGNGHAVYDITLSPLTSGTGSSRDEVNELRVENTLVIAHNFGLLTFRGTRGKRELLVQVMDGTGKELWQHTIAQENRKR